jgi:hypothetical protein
MDCRYQAGTGCYFCQFTLAQGAYKLLCASVFDWTCWIGVEIPGRA